MTDKEQIIINGINVSGCKSFYIHDRSTTNIDYWMYGQCKSSKEYGCYCRNNPNCYFKQLARKEQECEELKKELNGSEKWRIKAESLNEKLELNNDRYRKALEEIEKVCIEDTREFADGTTVRYDSLDDILDIINKAKGGE